MAYDAFISYSHAADGRLAPALQNGLQRLAKPWYRVRALRVFRDETGLATNPHLWSSILGALDEAEWFVLLASPESAASPWVDREIEHWLETKPAARILPALTAGEWAWDAEVGRLVGDAVPERLAATITEEPRHLDLRWAHDQSDLDLRNSGFRSAIVDLAAPMHGIAKDELEGEDIRQHRRARRLARVGITVVVLLLIVSVVFGGYAINQRDQANTERDRAAASGQESLARGLASEAEVLLRARRIDEALLVAVEAQRVAGQTESGGTAAARAQIALLRTLTTYPGVVGFLDGQPANARVMAYSPDGKIVASVSDTGQIRVWDAATRRLRAQQPPPVVANTFSEVALNDFGLMAVQGAGGIRLFDLKTNRPWRWQPPPDKGSSFALSNDGKLAVIPLVGGPLNVWDVTTGRRVAPALNIADLGFGFTRVVFSPDGRRIAVRFTRPSSTTIAVQLVDATTLSAGAQFDTHHGSYGTLFPFVDGLVFSRDGSRISSVASRGESIVGVGFGGAPSTEGAIATFDTRTGARIPEPDVAVGTEVLGASPDLGVIAVKTATGVAAIDGRTGATLAAVPTPGLDLTEPVAFDPTRTQFVAQSAEGSLTVVDWSRVSAAPFVSTSAPQRFAGPVADAAGRMTDLTEPLHILGLPAGCFSPVVPDCANGINAGKSNNYGNHQMSLAADDPRHPWAATESASGQVAILHATEIAIWDPTGHRIARRLTGVPKQCTTFYRQDLAFVGTARQGRVALGCAPALLSWDLTGSRSTPEWTTPWKGPGIDVPTPMLVSDDGALIAAPTWEGLRFVDGRTGRVRAKGPVLSIDNQTNGALSADGRMYAHLRWSGGLDLIDTATGKVIRTMTSSAGSLDDYGIAGESLTSGNRAPIAISADGGLVAVWHEPIGIEIWDIHTGESLAVLAVGSVPLGSLSTLAGTGEIDARFDHRLSAWFTARRHAARDRRARARPRCQRCGRDRSHNRDARRDLVSAA